MESKKGRNSHGYVEGSAVRKDWAVPDYGAETPVRKRPLTKEEFQRKKRQEESSRARIARKKKAQAENSLDFISILYLSAAIAVTMYVCVGYLGMQSDVLSMSKKAISLENELITIQNDNNADLQKINASIDLNYIYKVATKQLKMVHANKNQIIPFEGAKKDYVRKYDDIPEAKKDSITDIILNSQVHSR